MCSTVVSDILQEMATCHCLHYINSRGYTDSTEYLIEYFINTIINSTGSIVKGYGDNTRPQGLVSIVLNSSEIHAL